MVLMEPKLVYGVGKYRDSILFADFSFPSNYTTFDGSLSRGSTYSVATTWIQNDAYGEGEGNGGIQCKTSITMINRLGYFIATHWFCRGESFRSASLFVAPNKFCRK